VPSFSSTCGYNNGDEAVRIRDGTTTNTIQDNENNFNQKDGNDNFVFGMHESYAYYQSCKGTQRNKGLFTSDQNLARDDQRSTRQNAAGTQNGFECPEERDYHPWWGNSVWKDIAIITDESKDLCKYFQENSQNVQGRSYCTGAATTLQPINSQDCISKGGTWNNAPSFGIPKPDCIQADWTRDNHLGNTLTGTTTGYNWTLPTADQEKCIIGGNCICTVRIRYNVTSAEIDGYGAGDGEFDDSRLNANPTITSNPTVQVEGENLTLAVNTNQYGRTFEDRSYVFTIGPRPAGMSDKDKIYNLGVRGKRGNIVETYPATEYDFTPETLDMKIGDYIHFQWTGCDTNPAGNAGEGTDQTDRTNIAQMETTQSNRPLTDDQVNSGNIPLLVESAETRKNLATIGQTNCLTYAELVAKNGNNANAINTDKQNCAKLNAAPTPYFNGGLVKMNKTGAFYYMSTRNNNFTNRTQKGTIVVLPLLPAWAVALIVIGVVTVVLGGTLTGAYLYARKHPHGKLGHAFDKVGEKFSNLKEKLRRK